MVSKAKHNTTPVDNKMRRKIYKNANGSNASNVQCIDV